MSSKTHTDAVLALIDAGSTIVVCDGNVPDGTALPRNVLFTDSGNDEATNLEALPDLLTFRFQVNSSGLTRASVQIAADQARDAVIGVVPAVSGRSCSAIRQVNSRPITQDRDVTPHLMYAVNEYAFYSVAA
jgi:hypothetical protein